MMFVKTPELKALNERFLENLREMLDSTFHIKLEMIVSEEAIEGQLLNKKELMLGNNISCRRISKEKTIQRFFVENRFIRRMMQTSVKTLKGHENFRTGQISKIVGLFFDGFGDLVKGGNGYLWEVGFVV